MMKSINIFFATLITFLLYFLISLISIHYYNYFVPELRLLNLNENDIVSFIETIDTIETILTIFLVIILYLLCFKIYTHKSYKPYFAVISNLLLLLVGIIYVLYWETEFFYISETIEYENYSQTFYELNENSYEIFKLFVFMCIITSIILNVHFLSNIISKTRRYRFVVLAFISLTSLFFLKLGPFFKSKRVIWIKLKDEEIKVSHLDLLNLELNDNTPIWYKGIEKWITYREFKLSTLLILIK